MNRSIVVLAGVVTALAAASPAAADPPAPTVTSPTGDINVTQPTLQGTAGNASGDSDALVVHLTRVGGVTTNFDVVRNGTIWQKPLQTALPEGDYSVTVSQGNTMGETGTSPAHTFTVDTTPPTVTLAPAADTTVTKPTFKGTAEASENNTDKLRVVIHAGATVGGAVVDTVDGGITHEDDWEAPVVKALAPGTYTAEATDTDAAGNVGRSTPSTFTVDTTPPVVTLVSPADGAFTGDATPTVSVTRGADPGDLAPVTVSLVRGSRTVTCTVPAGAGSCDVADADALTEGDWTVTASQSDSAGNTATTPGRLLRVDLTAPRLTIDTPADGSAVTDSTPTIAGTTSTDPGDGSSVHLVISSPGAADVSLDAPVTRGHWSVAAPALKQGQITVRGTYADGGSHEVTATGKFLKSSNNSNPGGGSNYKLHKQAVKAARKALRKGKVTVTVTVTPPGGSHTFSGRLLLDAKTAKEAGVDGEKVTIHHNPFVLASRAKPVTTTNGRATVSWDIKKSEGARLLSGGHFTFVAQVTEFSNPLYDIKVKY